MYFGMVQPVTTWLGSPLPSPAVDLHVVLDNYGTHKHPGVRG